MKKFNFKSPKLQTTQTIFDSYFKNDAKTLRDLEKATYAYGFDELFGKVYAPHKFFREYPKGLSYKGACDFDTCVRCGRTRKEIRWDDLPAECENFIKYDIDETILSEEEKYFTLINKYEHTLPKIIKRRFKGVIDGNTLFKIQSDLGVDPDLVSIIMDVDIEQYMPEFEKLMRAHKELGKATSKFGKHVV